MIDTIKIRLYRHDLPDNIKTWIEHRFGIPDITTKNGRTTFWWKEGNMKIRLDDRALWVEGSLTKYSVGDNLKSADKEQLQNAIEKLGSVIGINLYKGVVTKLDIAANIRTVYPVKEYYAFLVDLSRLNRNEYRNGVAFENTSRYLSFYGKIKEMKRKRGVVIDEAFVNENILRFEYKPKHKSLEDYLKIKNPTVQCVFNRYDDIILLWKNAFESVDKAKDICEPTFEMFSDKGGFEAFLMMKGIEAIGGLKKVLNMVDVAKGRKYLCKYPNQSTNLKRRIKKVMLSNKYLRTSNLVKELEEKVAMIYQHAISPPVSTVSA